MTMHQLSSGDLIADRRADYARMLADSGDFASAAELMEQALELAQNWAAGWFMLGEFGEKAANRQAAAAAFRKVLALNPDDIFGAGLKLSLLGEVEMPEAPPVAYVEQLFDDYAEHFEESLLEKLDYKVPERLAELVINQVSRRFDCVIDLGCGTGLFGEQVAPLADRLEGFDLSANMLAKAGQKNVYAHLDQADLSLGVNEQRLFSDGLAAHRASLVAAADVVMYLGDLEKLFSLVRELLAPRGHFAFSAELYRGSDAGFMLQPSMRFAHSRDYVLDLMAKHGFQFMADEELVIRFDGGKPVHGILFVAQNLANQ